MENDIYLKERGINVTLFLHRMCILASVAFITSYLFNDRLNMILWILPFAFPAVYFHESLRKHREYKTVLWGTLYYYYLGLIFCNLFSSPFYLVDYFISMPLLGYAFLALKRLHAVFVCCLLMLGYLLTGIIVYYCILMIVQAL